MYAQLVPCGTAVEERSELERLIADQMIPALRQEPGFAGAWNLVDGTTGSAMLIVLWESAEQARRPREAYGPAYRRALAEPRGHHEMRLPAGLGVGSRRPHLTMCAKRQGAVPGARRRLSR